MKDFINSPEFKKAEATLAEFELSTLRELKNINLSDANECALLQAKTNYLKGAEQFMEILKWSAQSFEEVNFNDFI